MKNKFKVGDKVMICRISPNSCKLRYLGEIHTVANIYPDKRYGLELGCFFYEDELKLVEAKPFTKSDLKDGMIVEYSSDSRKMVVNETLFGIDSCSQLSNYSEELENLDGIESLNIDKVYSIPFTASLHYILKEADLSDYLVWSRTKPVEMPIVEMSISEIERILGYPIKIVEENKDV